MGRDVNVRGIKVTRKEWEENPLKQEDFLGESSWCYEAEKIVGRHSLVFGGGVFWDSKDFQARVIDYADLLKKVLVAETLTESLSEEELEEPLQGDYDDKEEFQRKLSEYEKRQAFLYDDEWGDLASYSVDDCIAAISALREVNNQYSYPFFIDYS